MKRIASCAAAIALALSAGAASKWNRYQTNIVEAVGNYDVTYRLGSDKAQRYWVKFEGRRVALENIKTAPGEKKEVTFTARVKGPATKDGGATKEAPFPDTLNLTVITDGDAPESPKIARDDAAKVIYLCGDSTVTDQPAEPWGSWGQCAPLFFGKGVAVANFARSGLTTDSFWKQGRLDRIAASAKTGDVVLIQFGHNDQKRENLKADVGGGYEKYLNRYIDVIEKTGAGAVIVTSVERLRYEKGVQQPHTLTEYAEAAKRVAAARKVPVIDLNDASYKVYGALGAEGAPKLFAKTDRTHHNIYGAYVMARIVMNELIRVKPEFAPYFRDMYRGFDPMNPPKDPGIPASGAVDLKRPEGDR